MAQLARSLARMLGLCEELAEAIALAHDVGHTPFGHAGEETLDRLLKEYGLPQGWNSNTHSLHVLDHLEFEHPSRPGLDLTYATREGIARHHTPFDLPADGFDDYPHPTLEAQAVNVADLLAYVAHDTEDAVFGGLITVEELLDADDEALGLWRDSLRTARAEFEVAGADDITLRPPEMRRRLMQRARRHFINAAVLAVYNEAKAEIEAAGISRHEDALRTPEPLVQYPVALRQQFEALAMYLLHRVYRSPLVARQNHREAHILQSVFRALVQDSENNLLPYHYRDRLRGSAPGDHQRLENLAYFVASLSDRAVHDLYAELFDPRERTMTRRL